jgi:hypothetical protein
MLINKALYNYDYSAFNLSILEYIDIINLSKDEAKIIILKREQHYLDTLFFSRKTALYFNVFKDMIIKYARSGKLFKNEWIVSIETKNELIYFNYFRIKSLLLYIKE